jgi:hypothetical protein
MRRIIKIIILIIAIISNINAQNFHSAYTFPDIPVVKSVAFTQDGGDGFMIVASGPSESLGGKEILCFVKIDVGFNVQWTKSFDINPPASTQFNLRAFDIKHDDINGGYLVCGRFDKIPQMEIGGFMLYINDNADYIWMKDIIDYNPLTEQCYQLNSVEIVGDNYLACGYSRYQNSTDKMGFIVNIDRNTQSTLWVKVILPYFGFNESELNDIVFEGNQILSCGTIINGTTSSGVILTSLDLNGNNNYANVYNLDGLDGKALTVDNQNNIFIVGSHYENVYFLKVNIAGQYLLNKRYHFKDINSSSDILYFNDHVYIIGRVSSGDPCREGFLTIADTDGNNPSSILYSGLYNINQPPQWCNVDFSQILKREIISTPSLIKVGLINDGIGFYITETYLPYQNDYCQDNWVNTDISEISPVTTPIDIYEPGHDMNMFGFPTTIYPDCYKEVVCQGILGSGLSKTNIKTKKQMNDRPNEKVKIILHTTKDKLYLSDIIDGYQICSIDGRIIEKRSSYKSDVVKIDGLKEGIYILIISNDKDQKAIKFVK